jgi:hypothetical protein
MELINTYLEKINKKNMFLSSDLKQIEKYFLEKKEDIVNTYKESFVQIIKKEILDYFEHSNPENLDYAYDEDTIEQRRKEYDFYKNISSLIFAPIGIEYYDDHYEYISSCLSLYEKSNSIYETENEQINIDDDNYDYFSHIIDFLNSRVREDVLYILFESRLEIVF